MAKLRVFEAFSGIGTQTMGLSRANIDHDVVAISEIDSYAILMRFVLTKLFTAR